MQKRTREILVQKLLVNSYVPGLELRLAPYLKENASNNQLLSSVSCQSDEENKCNSSKMASGGLMCEVSAVPKIGHKIESMEFLESLGKIFKLIRNQGAL